MKIRTKYERVVERVNNGTSVIFENWHEHTGISKEKFLEGIKWLYEEPVYFPSDKRLHNHDKLRRQLGINNDGTLVYLDRVYFENGDFCGFYDTKTHHRWYGNTSLNADDRIWDDSEKYSVR